MRRVVLTVYAILFSTNFSFAQAQNPLQEARRTYLGIFSSPHTNPSEVCRGMVWAVLRRMYLTNIAAETKSLRDARCVDRYFSVTKYDNVQGAVGEILTNGAARRSVRQTVHAIPGETRLPHVRVINFYERTPGDFAKVLATWREKPTYLVIDLRGNRGGLVEKVLEMLDFFAPAGGLISLTQVGNEETHYYTHAPGILKDAALDLLIDHECASACEIFAGTLRYWKGGAVRLLGTRTAGKGTIQNVVEYKSIELRYTTDEFFVGYGESRVKINGVGLSPDGPIPKGY